MDQRVQWVAVVDRAAPLVQHPQPVEHLVHLGRRLVDHRDHQPSGRGLRLQQRYDVDRVGRRKAAGGLVHEQHRRTAHQLQRYVEPLPLPAADGLVQRRSDAQVGCVELVKLVQDAPAALADLGVGQAGEAEARAVVQVLEDGQVLEQQVVLGHVADDPAAGHRPVGDVAPVEQQPAGARAQTARQQGEQGRLPRAAPSHHRDQLPAPGREGEVVKPLVRRAAVAEVQVVALQHVDRREARRDRERRRNLAEVDAVAHPVGYDGALPERVRPRPRRHAVQQQLRARRGPEEPRGLVGAEDREGAAELRTVQGPGARPGASRRVSVDRDKEPVVQPLPVPREVPAAEQRVARDQRLRQGEGFGERRKQRVAPVDAGRGLDQGGQHGYLLLSRGLSPESGGHRGPPLREQGGGRLALHVEREVVELEVWLDSVQPQVIPQVRCRPLPHALAKAVRRGRGADGEEVQHSVQSYLGHRHGLCTSRKWAGGSVPEERPRPARPVTGRARPTGRGRI